METEAKIVTLSYNCQLPYIVKGHDKGNTYQDAAPTALAFVAPLRALLRAPYSRPQLGVVIRYIEHQHQHHAKKSFLDEYTSLLDKFAVEYDQRYVFKPIDG